MRSPKIITLKLVLLAVALSFHFGCAAAPPSSDAMQSHAALPRQTASTPGLMDVAPPARAGVKVIELRGDPTEIGTQHGAQCGEAIHLLFEKYLNVLVPPSQHFQASLAAVVFEANMLPEHRTELVALSNQLKLPQTDVALAQCFLDLSPATGCSTIALPASASPDGVARFGRNLDFPSLNIADKYSVLFVYHPKDRYQFAAVGWPGMIGVVSGMNEYGLSLANMEVPRAMRAPDAMPYTLLYRMILERCKTVDEAIDLLKKTPRQTANNLMLMDAAGNRAVAEIRPQDVTVRRGSASAALLSTNHQRGQDADQPGLCWRYDALHAAAAAQYGKIDPKTLEWMLGKVVQGNHGDMTLQSMIFEPANRVLYLATGADAPSQAYEKIDLKVYFQPRPAQTN